MSSLNDPWNTSKSHTTTAYEYSSNGNFEREASFETPVYHNASRPQISVRVALVEELAGKWISKHHLYSVEFNGLSILRRYSDWNLLHTYILRIYTFRLIPPLPPKRLAVSGRHFTDAGFLSRRAKGLARYSNAVLNHHIMRTDPVVLAFFSEPAFDRQLCNQAGGREEECWRTLSPAEEASVPADLDELLSTLQQETLELANIWTRCCQALERIANRAQADADDYGRLSQNMQEASDHLMIGFPSTSRTLSRQLSSCSKFYSSHSANLDTTSTQQIDTILEMLKSHRELFSSFRDLLHRRNRASADEVDKLRARVGTAARKREAILADAKPGSEIESERISVSIDSDNQRIDALLRRRLFIRKARPTINAVVHGTSTYKRTTGFAIWQEADSLSHSILRLASTLQQQSGLAQRFSELALSTFSSLSEEIAA